MTALTIVKPGPLATLQDAGRFGHLADGISASGPMDRGAFLAAGAMLPSSGSTAIEFSQSLALNADGPVRVAAAGGHFRLSLNGRDEPWPTVLSLAAGDRLDIAPGDWGNYGYLRFDAELDAPLLLGSRSTNVTVGLGGHKGRALRAGDRLTLAAGGQPVAPPPHRATQGDIRVLWGLHAELFDPAARQAFVASAFTISPDLDRMGVRLADPTAIFRNQRRLSLVSDAIVPGDIQILGDGTPIVLMRDHQPTGGYPRIATIVSADLDRFAQLRPGAELRFRPVTLEHAR